MSDERRFYEAPAAGVRRSAPAALRNREPIAEVLGDWLPRSGLVLEIASGTGEHVVHFAARFPALDWQPSDIHPGALASIAAVREETGLPNVRAPIAIDAAVFAYDDRRPRRNQPGARLIPLATLRPGHAWIGLGGEL